jgi:hypothetical protein
VVVGGVIKNEVFARVPPMEIEKKSHATEVLRLLYGLEGFEKKN